MIARINSLAATDRWVDLSCLDPRESSSVHVSGYHTSKERYSLESNYINLENKVQGEENKWKVSPPSSHW